MIFFAPITFVVIVLVSDSPMAASTGAMMSTRVFPVVLRALQEGGVTWSMFGTGVLLCSCILSPDWRRHPKSSVGIMAVFSLGFSIAHYFCSLDVASWTGVADSASVKEFIYGATNLFRHCTFSSEVTYPVLDTDSFM